MAQAVLQKRQRELLQQERRLANELQACLASFEGADAHASTLRQVTDALDDLFLLVIVGEFNAGKSACINALLHENVLEEGVVPTTHQVTIVRHGQENEQRVLASNILEIDAPADFLRDISIVDTPGVNAVLREHERLTPLYRRLAKIDRLVLRYIPFLRRYCWNVGVYAVKAG